MEVLALPLAMLSVYALAFDSALFALFVASAAAVLIACDLALFAFVVASFLALVSADEMSAAETPPSTTSLPEFA